MAIKLDNDIAIKCIMHVIHDKLDCKYSIAEAIKDILTIIDEQGADYILQEILERLVYDKD